MILNFTLYYKPVYAVSVFAHMRIQLASLYVTQIFVVLTFTVVGPSAKTVKVSHYTVSGSEVLGCSITVHSSQTSFSLQKLSAAL